MQQITPTQLAQELEAGDKPLLLDVREPWEFDHCRIEGSQLMPMQTIPLRLGELDPDMRIVCICHHGARSMQVGLFLESRGFANVVNLSGGVAAWARSVDPAMPTY
ncbi:MAG: sulfurtransferase [Sterolibacteriaceae bacterium]|jgi:rhodanese-related sulfurtransferase|uniref:Sulfurtransferase n=1 Tax=Candidatus Methylophosphatis roskildensis TaxID=2899263 RepID=A0A9D7DV75_9PROT|nr:sulfurtransferase [Candidatus Methylophosphatis roskildensis]MBK7234499.1 sulfurtransferase [Sterolibacteriaceae bacterium]